MRRKDFASGVALGAMALVAGLLALHFDLASLLLRDVPAPAEAPVASAAKRVGATADAAPIDRRPADDRPVKAPSSSFDVVRIDPEGASVFAGRAPANSSVTVLANENPVATAKASEDGQWAAVIDRQFAPGEYQLSLTAKPGGSGTLLSGQSVNITIAANARPAQALPKVAAPLPPTPIRFPYDDASFTAIGRQQAAALSEFLCLRQPDAVTLSGHADSRGSDEYNMVLSRNRLQSVARFLRESGYAGKLVLVPKGKSEPFVSADRNALSPEEAFQLDRRVQLHLAQ